MRAGFRHLFVVLLICAPVVVTVVAGDQPPNAFDLPRLQAEQVAEHTRIAALLDEGDFAEAEQRLRRAIERIPQDSGAHYLLACVLARQDRADEALSTLEQAVAMGFHDEERLTTDESLESLRADQRFQAILEAARTADADEPQGWKYEVEPAVPANGRVVISERNVVWTRGLRMFRAFVDFPESARQPVAQGTGETDELLQQWYEEGTAAGNHGDLYDNHDGGHSTFDLNSLPQLTRVEYSSAARQRRLHYGVQLSFLFNAVTIGNSSTAHTSEPYWRSQGREALTEPGGPERLYVQYRANQLYFYPEHRDHDPDHGDLFPANTPYMILSQGSSYTDQPFMDAVARTLAAFHPEVKRQLAQAGLLMPTVQMIFRSSNRMVVAPKDYLTGRAHPTVFDAEQLDVVKMLHMAHDMTPAALPPLVQLKVLEEDEGEVGRDYFDVGPRERLFDTPCAVARIVKSLQYERRMVVSAEESADLGGRPLTYHWVVLRGDADRIQIRPLNESGSVVELRVPCHERAPIPGTPDIESNRVDIGVFVHNGDYYSAPAFISLLYPTREKRVYDEQHRLRIVDYQHVSVRHNYTDPRLDLQKDWRDVYHYDDDGRLLGWTRIHRLQRDEFTPEGRLIVEADEQGRPVTTTAVRYVQTRNSDTLRLTWEPVEAAETDEQ